MFVGKIVSTIIFRNWNFFFFIFFVCNLIYLGIVLHLEKFSHNWNERQGEKNVKY